MATTALTIQPDEQKGLDLKLSKHFFFFYKYVRFVAHFVQFLEPFSTVMVQNSPISECVSPSLSPFPPCDWRVYFSCAFRCVLLPGCVRAPFSCALFGHVFSACEARLQTKCVSNQRFFFARAREGEEERGERGKCSHV